MNADPKIAYVLFVDIVGYSKHNTSTQAALVSRLVELAKGCETYRRLKKRRKLIAAPAGDGFVLACYDEVGAPARLGFELLAEVKACSEFEVRMAAHVGLAESSRDVSGSTNVFGEGVTIACRAAEFASPGDLVVTDRYYELVSDLSEFEGHFEALGEEPIKHGHELELFRLLDPHAPFAALSRTEKRAEIIHARAVRAGKMTIAPMPLIAKRLERIRRDVIVGLSLFLLLEGLHFVVEKGTLATNLKMWAYDQLQPFMPKPEGPMKVVVVSLGKGFLTARGDRTDPKKLAALLEVINRSSPDVKRPLAIGIDIQFDNIPIEKEDPDGNLIKIPGFVDPDGYVYDQIKALRRQDPPVMAFVGVRNPYETSPDQVFATGADRTENALSWDHVAHVYAPTGDSYERRYLYGDLRLFAEDWLPRSPERIGSLAMDIKAALIRSGLEPISWPHSVFQQVAIGTLWEDPAMHARLEGERYLLNYGGLDTLMRETISLGSPAMLEARTAEFLKAISGKAVLIGRADDKSDVLYAPVIGPIPGVYYHAVGVYTLASSPILEFKLVPGLIFGSITSLIELLVSAAMRVRWICSPNEVSDERLRGFISILLVVATTPLALFLLFEGGVMWNEFPLIALALILDPVLEHRIHHFIRKLRRFAQSSRIFHPFTKGHL